MAVRATRSHGQGGSEEVEVLSWARWGIGSLTVIALLTSLATMLLFRWLTSRSPTTLAESIVLYFGGAVVFFVKASERIERRSLKMDVVGTVGFVLKEVSSKSDGVVIAGGYEWSATSGTELKPGERVRVVARQGLRLVVERATT